MPISYTIQHGDNIERCEVHTSAPRIDQRIMIVIVPRDAGLSPMRVNLMLHTLGNTGGVLAPEPNTPTVVRVWHDSLSDEFPEEISALFRDNSCIDNMSVTEPEDTYTEHQPTPKAPKIKDHKPTSKGPKIEDHPAGVRRGDKRPHPTDEGEKPKVPAKRHSG
ncbi:hypothetical protein NEOLEDRAFT_1148776 [Neolentinus lepideus HHB14362 ss-1]|uniref:Uncharacterized protein n=1 Tax=Neolentinus lepideus HHB14362 ss-1 TaxID=1314782 RepID=A0A165RY99_9AGAM|nr:hypothetical protein NEOLEDRAFT_1148776 [Neolentinus lepideus HHB14362 ss-1]